MRTRRSAPTGSDDGEDDHMRRLIDPKTGEVPRSVRELIIDNGQKEEKKEMGYYTWRGASYAIDENTPQEWIDAEAHLRKDAEKKANAPVRPRKSKSETSANAPVRFTNLKPRDPKLRSVTPDEEEMHQEQDEGQVEELLSTAAVIDKNSKRPREASREAEPVRTKKPKQQQKDPTSLKNRPPKGHYLFPALSTKPEKKKKKRSKSVPKPNIPRAKEEEEHVEQEYVEQELVEQEHVEQEHVEQEHVDQEHVEQEHVEQEHVEQDRQSAPQMELRDTATVPDMSLALSIAVNDEDKKMISRIFCQVTEPEANPLATTIVDLAKIQARAQNNLARSEALLSTMKEFKDQLLAKQGRESPTRDSVMAQDSVLGAQDIQHPSSPKESPIEMDHHAAPTSRMPSLSHSAQSELEWYAPSPTTSQYMNPVPDSDHDGGPPGQYSSNLTAEKLQAALDGYTPAAMHSGQVIDRSRLAVESPNAKLRRIQREVAILQNLPRLLDDWQPVNNSISASSASGGK